MTFGYLPGWKKRLVAVAVFACLSIAASTAHAIVSDDFSSTQLDTVLWRFDTPIGEPTLVMTGTNALIDIPGGASHDLWHMCNCAPRLLQSAADTDFEVEAKFDSHPEAQFQLQGIVVHEDNDTFLRFDVHSDGINTFVFAARINGGSSSTKVLTQIVGVPAYVRVNRTNNMWTYDYSMDGSNWTNAVSFTQPMTVTEIGPFIGSHLDDFESPAFVGNIDYFFDTSSPISPEDGGAPTAPTPPVIEVWLGDNQDFGHLGNPQTLIQVMGRVWDTDAISSLTYQLNGGASNPLTVGPDALRLIQIGDYNIEIDNSALNNGANTVTITALDTLGEQTVENVTVNYSAGNSWPTQTVIDWQSAASIQDVAQVTDGKWYLTSEGARTDSARTGYDRLIVLGNNDWVTEYEVLLPMTIHASRTPGAIGLAMGWSGHTGGAQPKAGHPYQVVSWIEDFPSAPKLRLLRNLDITVAETAVAVSADTKYFMRVRSQSIGGGMSRVNTKFWQDGMAEPIDWMLTEDFTTMAGSVMLIAHHSDATFGNVTVTPIANLPQRTLTTTVNGNGAITRNPDSPTYAENSLVELTAVPDPGWSFTGWSNGLTGTINPDSVIMASDTTITASFAQENYTLTVNEVGGGTVDVVPDQATYVYGDTIILTANPDGGLYFLGWTGDLTGTENPDTLVMTASSTVTASFGIPAYTITTNTVGNGSLTLDPDQPTYAIGDTVLVTAVPDPTYEFSQWSGDLTGNTNPDTLFMFGDKNITGSFVLGSGLQSDDFSSTVLDTSIWRVLDPNGEATVKMTGTNVLIDIPGGLSYDLWNTCQCATRLLQASIDTDFEVEAKFDSEGTAEANMQGIVVHQDDDTFLRFDTFFDGTDHNVLAAFADGAGFPSIKVLDVLPDAPRYLRVRRTGDLWEFWYSFDGTNFMSAISFSQSVAVTEVGLFIGSHLDAYETPAFVGNIDYFFNTANRIIPEDGGAPTAPTPPCVEIWLGDNQDFGNLGNPQTLVQVMGRVWDTDALASLSYKLNGGSSQPLTIGPDALRLIQIGDYVIDIDNSALNAGANSLMIMAIDTLGEQTDTTITVNYTAGQTWPIPDVVDWQGGADIQDVGQVVDGKWSILPSGVRTDSSRTGYDRLLVVGNNDWPLDYEVDVPITIHSSRDEGGIGMAVGWKGHTGVDQPRSGHPYTAVSWVQQFDTTPVLRLLQNGDVTTVETPVTAVANTLYRMKVRSESIGGGMTRVRSKFWEDGTAEPGWMLDDDFVTHTGSILLIAHFSDVTFGDVSMTPLAGFGTHVLTTNVNGSGTIVRTPNLSQYQSGVDVELTAVPDPGWSFSNWSDGLSGIANPDTVTMFSDSTVTANFVQETYTITLNTTGSGQAIKSPDQPTYLFGDTVIVTAIPDVGWTFASWAGGLTGSENPDTIVVSGDSTATANFTMGEFAITLNTNGDGQASKSPDQASYSLGDTVIVTATPDPGWMFSNWSGGLTGSENPDTIIVSSDSTATANFTQDQYTITLNTNGDGQVSKSPDQPNYVFGDTVIISAMPDPGWAFANWSGGLSGTENPDTIVVSSDSTATANFTQAQYAITLMSSGDGQLTKSPDQPTYLFGDTVIVTATPDPTWLFLNWSAGLTGAENPDTVVVASDTTVTAVFVPEMPSLGITINGLGGVAKNPDKPLYVNGEDVILTATPDSGWVFTGWTEDLSGMQNPETLTMVGNKSVSANFTPGSKLTLDIIGNGQVTASPVKPFYTPGDTIVLTATPLGGDVFKYWSGPINSAQNPDTLIIGGDTEVNATFGATPTGIGDLPPTDGFAVRQNYPNPFSSGTTINFAMPDPGDVRIEVFDVRGRRVFSQELPSQTRGWHQYYFDPTNVGGRRLAAGVYFYRVHSAMGVVEKKMVIAR